MYEEQFGILFFIKFKIRIKKFLLRSILNPNYEKIGNFVYYRLNYTQKPLKPKLLKS